MSFMCFHAICILCRPCPPHHLYAQPSSVAYWAEWVGVMNFPPGNSFSRTRPLSKSDVWPSTSMVQLHQNVFPFPSSGAPTCHHHQGHHFHQSPGMPEQHEYLGTPTELQTIQWISLLLRYPHVKWAQQRVVATWAFFTVKKLWRYQTQTKLSITRYECKECNLDDKF